MQKPRNQIEPIYVDNSVAQSIRQAVDRELARGKEQHAQAIQPAKRVERTKSSLKEKAKYVRKLIGLGD